jgi:glutamyl-tRNA synthetase
MDNREPLRTRIAPSPTGDPHVGTSRNALYNYFLSKKTDGQFIMRLEDTDQAREVPGSYEKINEALAWVGTIPDEGVLEGGPYGPYKQTERKEIYKKYTDELIEKGHAYYCFCSQERLAQVREEQAKNHQPPRYDRYCRNLDPVEAKKRAESESYVIRMVIPDGEEIVFNDRIKGEVSFKSNEIDDQVLMKSDGLPTYHLAAVVDDHEMRINLVLRSDEWLSSTPKHLLLYKYFGWDAPVFGHLPLILNTDHSKISKRKNNTSVLYYKVEQGYHPMAFAHFLMFMGWSPVEVKENYTLLDFQEAFSLDRVGVSPAVYDIAKLNSLGHSYFVAEEIKVLEKMYLDWLNDSRHELTKSEKMYVDMVKVEPEAALAMLEVSRLRGNTFREVSQEMEVLLISDFTNLTTGNLLMDGKVDKAQAEEALKVITGAVEHIEVDSLPVAINDRVQYLTDYFKKVQPESLGGRPYLHPTRVAITGKVQSMNMFEYLAAYLMLKDGKVEIVSRLTNAQKLIETS